MKKKQKTKLDGGKFDFKNFTITFKLTIKLYVRGVETSEDDKNMEMRSKLQEEIHILKWQEGILDKQLEVVFNILLYSK